MPRLLVGVGLLRLLAVDMGEHHISLIILSYTIICETFSKSSSKISKLFCAIQQKALLQNHQMTLDLISYTFPVVYLHI